MTEPETPAPPDTERHPGSPRVDAPLAVAPAHPRRFVYFGTPEMAVEPLRALHAAGHDIALVVSRADKKRGRGSALQPSPVKAAALELGLAVTDDPAAAADVGADLGIVVAFGRIIKRSLLEQLPMVNLHFSLLPRWRGAAPVERAILAGDAQTGVDLMVVEEGLDTGGIYAETVLEIRPDESADELRVRLVEAGTRLLLTALADGFGAPRPQVGETVYAAKIDPAELAIDWTRPAADLDRLVRVGGAWTTFQGKRLKVWRSCAKPSHGTPPPAPGAVVAANGVELRVATGAGDLVLLELQPEGKKRQEARAWANGARPDPTMRFGA